MARGETFLERLADAAIEAARRILERATEALDALVPDEVPSPPAEGIQRPEPRESRTRGARSRPRRSGLEERLAALTELVTQQSSALENQRGEIERLRALRAREDEREARRLSAAERSEARASERLNRYPRRLYGRLGRLQWTAENLRLQGRDVDLLRMKYDELLRAGVPEGSMAVVAVAEDLFQLYVAGS